MGKKSLGERARLAAIRAHTSLYRRTNGRAGGMLAGLQHVLLTTRGRRSGEPRTVPLAITPVGDTIVLVASNAGSPTDPAWYLNLKAHPEAVVQLGPREFRVRTRTATGEERARLWDEVVENNPGYLRYQERTTRELPLVVCEKISAPESRAHRRAP